MYFSPDNGGQLQITNKGFQFLLQDVNTQVWAFLLQYLDMAEVRVYKVQCMDTCLNKSLSGASNGSSRSAQLFLSAWIIRTRRSN